MMPYWQRVVLGFLMGLLALLGLWYFVGISWLTAAVAGLVAPLVFLGSFFLFSADRPDEGYEQVLFDRPNTLLALAMIVLMAGAGVASGHLDVGPSAAASGRGMDALVKDYQAAYASYQKGEIAGAELGARLDALLAELDGFPEGKPREWLAKTLQASKACAGAGSLECPAAFDSFVEYRLAGGPS